MKNYSQYTKAELIKEIEKLKQLQSNEESVVNDALYSSASGVVITDLEDRINYVNPAFLNMFEYDKPSDVIGKKAAELFASKRVESLSDVEEIIDGDTGDVEECPVRQSTGSIITVEVSSTIVKDKHDRIVGRMASFVNISKRKEAEKALNDAKNELEKLVEERTKELQESEEKFRILSEKSLIGVFIDQDGEFKYLNPSFARIFGYDYKKDFNFLIKKTLEDFIVGEDWRETDDMNSKLMSGAISSMYSQSRGRKKNGEVVYLDIYKSIIRFKGRLAVIGSLIDITERKKTEDKLKKKSEELAELNITLEERIERELQKHKKQEEILIQQSKLASMGEMVGAISHQWRQPISTVSLILQNIREAYEFGDITREMLDEFVDKGIKQIEYMSGTIDDFRNFFKPIQAKENFSITETVNETLSLLKAQLDAKLIEVDIRCGMKEDAKVNGYPNEFKQVLINIINNSKDEIIEKQIRGKLDKGRILIKVYKRGSYFYVSVRDNGGGIPDTVINRVFEPYFTTKEQGKGIGIGLYMSRRIINNMGGQIFARNVEKGAVFTIKLKKVKE